MKWLSRLVELVVLGIISVLLFQGLFTTGLLLVAGNKNRFYWGDEAAAAFWYMILPAVGGVLAARVALYVWVDHLRPQTQLRCVWAASVVIGVFPAAVCYFVILAAVLLFTKGKYDFTTISLGVTMAALLVGPVMLMSGLNLIVYLIYQARAASLLVMAYAGSALALVLEHLWVGNVASHW